MRKVGSVLWNAFWVFLAPVLALWALAWYGAYVLEVAFVGVLLGGTVLWLLTLPFKGLRRLLWRIRNPWA